MLTGSWKRGMDAAKAASLLSNGTSLGYRLGAALYAGSNLLSVGYNDWRKSHPHGKNGEFDGNTHAEAMCLVKRRHYDNPSNLILYVSRTATNPKRTEEWDACSRPCERCMKLIELAGVRRIRFYDEEGNPAEIKL